MSIFKTSQALANFYIKFQDFPYFSRICTNPVCTTCVQNILSIFHTTARRPIQGGRSQAETSMGNAGRHKLMRINCLTVTGAATEADRQPTKPKCQPVLFCYSSWSALSASVANKTFITRTARPGPALGRLQQLPFAFPARRQTQWCASEFEQPLLQTAGRYDHCHEVQ